MHIKHHIAQRIAEIDDELIEHTLEGNETMLAQLQKQRLELMELHDTLF